MEKRDWWFEPFYGLGCQKNYSLVLQAIAVLTLHFCGLINTVNNSAFCKESMYTPSVEHGLPAGCSEQE